MPIELKASDIMVSMDDYGVTFVDEQLRDAVRDLAKNILFKEVTWRNLKKCINVKR